MARGLLRMTLLVDFFNVQYKGIAGKIFFEKGNYELEFINQLSRGFTGKLSCSALNRYSEIQQKLGLKKGDAWYVVTAS